MRRSEGYHVGRFAVMEMGFGGGVIPMFCWFIYEDRVDFHLVLH